MFRQKKSSRSPGLTVSRFSPENPPIRLTPNNEEIASLVRKANRMGNPGSPVIRLHASNGVIATGSGIDRVS